MIVFYDACEKNMQEVAEVHIKCFENYFLTSLGKELIAEYYMQFLKEDNLFIIAKDTETDKIVGFCMGCKHGCRAKERFIDENKGTLMKKLLILCLKMDRKALSRCFNRVCSMFVKKNNNTVSVNDKKRATLLSIGVLSEYRGTGQNVSYSLINLYQEKLKSKGFEICTLSALSDNSRARKFYLKNGFQESSVDGKSVNYIKQIWY